MKLIKQFLIAMSLITCGQLHSQTLICTNGGFENGGTGYSFAEDIIEFDPVDCDFDYSLLTGYSLTTVNDFIARMTLVDNNTSIANGNDPTMYSLPSPVSIPRVNTDSLAMKLGSESFRLHAAGLRKKFEVYEEEVTFSYSLIMRTLNSYGPSDTTLKPHFRARLYNSSGGVIDEICIEADPTNALFSVVYDTTADPNETMPYLYTGWQCATLSTSPAIDGDDLILEILVTDSYSEPLAFGTVYIDDICNVPCCPECPDIEIDVPVGDSSHEAAETCLNLYNTVNDEAIVDYHAGFEVVMLPGEPLDPSAVPGFESLYGSDGYYHIEECHDTAEPEERQNMFIEQGGTGSLQIFPNPANGELNIVSGTNMVSLTLVGLDGKAIIAKQLDGKNDKLDLNGIAQGVYILTVETTNGSITSHKIIKE